MILCLPYLYPYVVYFGTRLIQPKKKTHQKYKGKTKQTKQNKQNKSQPNKKKNGRNLKKTEYRYLSSLITELTCQIIILF